MEIETADVTKIRLTKLDRLDPVDVILEDIEPRKGKITISCFGKSWTAYWGGMGDRTIAEFFCSCDNGYLTGNLAPNLNSNEPDYDAIRSLVEKKIREEMADICQQRKEEFLGADDAREKYDELDSLLQFDIPIFESVSDIHHWEHTEKYFGEEYWHLDLPTKPNSDYVYLCRIIDAVKDGLKQVATTKAQAA